MTTLEIVLTVLLVIVLTIDAVWLWDRRPWVSHVPEFTDTSESTSDSTRRYSPTTR
jgi:hypothetical protein